MSQDRITIGRDSGSDLHLPDSSVSRHHAQAERLSSGHIRIVDLGSTNGSFFRTDGAKTRFKSRDFGPGETVIFGKADVQMMRLLEVFRRRETTQADPVILPPNPGSPNHPAKSRSKASSNTPPASPPVPQPRRRGRPRRDPVTNELIYDD